MFGIAIQKETSNQSFYGPTFHLKFFDHPREVLGYRRHTNIRKNFVIPHGFQKNPMVLLYKFRLKEANETNYTK